MHRTTSTLALTLVLALGGWACGGDRVTGSIDGLDVSTPDIVASSDTVPSDAANDGLDADVTDTVNMVDGVADSGQAEDPSDLLFPDDRVIEVAITMAAADFEALRHQTRTFYDILGAICDDQPVPDPFTWFHASATIDGHTVTDIGVRKKGFLGSLDAERPALKLKLDAFVDDQELLGLERLTLNNGRQDPSRLRTCLAYDVFRAAGVPTPRCAFAHVVVNGADLGLYAHVESMKKDFVRRWFPEPLGELYEGTVSDFREGWTGTFERKYDDEDPQSDILDRVVAAAAVPDDQLIAALDEVIDLDAFFTFWAVEVVVGHWDGYANNRNNFLVYADPRDGKLRFVPWGPDGAFSPAPNAPEGAPDSVFADGVLAHRLYSVPAGRTRYHAALQRVLADAFDEVALLAEADRLVALTADARAAAAIPAAVADVAAVRGFISGRRAAIEAELASPPDWPYPLGGRPCLVDRGRVYGTLATTWGNLDEPDIFATGDAQLGFETEFFTGTLPPPGGSKAGPDPDDPTHARLQLVRPAEVNVYIVVDISLPLALFAPGDVDTEAPGVQVLIYRLEPDVSVDLIGYLRGGVVSFSEALAVDGSPVQATFDLRLLMF
ncbi:MAG: hypothetical protein CVU56_04250 [Deltaproteobacteria bacterium HGW-Deltaproteobacteria-14]|jgi:hypothetical protein|nr:MAG: hypothetical protein CVU56_04250 [Deltaproteobacteria bacterium HGW-Deltaproteobacteria-14]